MKITTVVGARPQFIKAAVVSRALKATGSVSERLVHTGQHFDENMSQIFFDELGIKAPEANLAIGGGSHGENTGRMLEAIEADLLRHAPDCVLVYGDTDSTLAATLAAVKLHIPIAHVEAGLRSFNRRMPEEINRILTDHSSTLLFAPTSRAVSNLEDEGIRGSEKVCLVGDVMCDAAHYHGRQAQLESRVFESLSLPSGDYVLLTLHRPSNTDERVTLTAILGALDNSRLPVLWPIHPRTRKRIEQFGLDLPSTVRAFDPVGYLDMVMLEKNARLIVTDSGGIQKEAFFHAVSCITLRNETEWTELVELGVNRLIGSDWKLLSQVLAGEIPRFSPLDARQPYGSGDAGSAIAEVLVDRLGEWAK